MIVLLPTVCLTSLLVVTVSGFAEELADQLGRQDRGLQERSTTLETRKQRVQREGDYYGTGLTIAETRKAIRNKIRHKFPDVQEPRLSQLVEHSLVKRRQRAVRKRALEIQIRERYSHLSEDDRDVLLEDALIRERERAEERTR